MKIQLAMPYVTGSVKTRHNRTTPNIQHKVMGEILTYHCIINIKIKLFVSLAQNIWFHYHYRRVRNAVCVYITSHNYFLSLIFPLHLKWNKLMLGYFQGAMQKPQQLICNFIFTIYKLFCNSSITLLCIVKEAILDFFTHEATYTTCSLGCVWTYIHRQVIGVHTHLHTLRKQFQ